MTKLPLDIIQIIDGYLKSKYLDEYYISTYTNGYEAYCKTDNQWVVLLREEVVFIDEKSKKICDITELYSFYGHFFEIYYHEDDFIIYGECAILRLSRDHEILWQFNGRDIFFLPDNYKSFFLEKEKIVVFDWIGWCYHISYDGNLLAENWEFDPEEEIICPIIDQKISELDCYEFQSGCTDSKPYKCYSKYGHEEMLKICASCRYNGLN